MLHLVHLLSCVGCLQGPNDASTVPLELSFMESYGSITQHLWFGDGYILVGFRSGQVVVVSSLRCAACYTKGLLTDGHPATQQQPPVTTLELSEEEASFVRRRLRQEPKVTN
jgi:hypothetical protein